MCRSASLQLSEGLRLGLQEGRSLQRLLSVCVGVCVWARGRFSILADVYYHYPKVLRKPPAEKHPTHPRHPGANGCSRVLSPTTAYSQH